MGKFTCGCESAVPGENLSHQNESDKKQREEKGRLIKCKLALVTGTLSESRKQNNSKRSE